MPVRRSPIALIAALALAASALAATGSPPAAAAPSPPCERDAGTLTADTAIAGSWAETCQSAELQTTTAGGSMFHSFALSARRMVTIGLASSAGDAELVLRKGSGRTGVALEEDDDGGTGTNARVRLPLDAGTYTIEAAVKASAIGAYTLAIGLVAPPTMTYPTFDTTGNTATAGSYSILTSEGEAARAVATYEELRKSASAVRLSLTDGGGVSHAAFYSTVEAGDVFEWREAPDCWTRYQVTSATAPGSGATSREFGVKWVTYAYSGCSGALPATLAATMSWYPRDVGGSSLASPVVHGVFHIKPAVWAGLLQGSTYHAPPKLSKNTPVHTRDTTVAATLPYWRHPALPAGWTLEFATSGSVTDPPYGYCAHFYRGHLGVEICAGHMARRSGAGSSSNSNGVAWETRTISDRPALVRYMPLNPGSAVPVVVGVYDAATECLYTVTGRGGFRGANINPVIAIARSLFDSTTPAPPVTGHGPAYGAPD